MRGRIASRHLFAAVAHEHRAALPIRDPVRPHRRARREQLLGDHVALEEGPLAPAVAPGPRHADEPLLAAAPAELRRVAVEPRAEARDEGPGGRSRAREIRARAHAGARWPRGVASTRSGCSGSRQAHRTTAAFGTDGGRLSRIRRADPSRRVRNIIGNDNFRIGAFSARHTVVPGVRSASSGSPIHGDAGATEDPRTGSGVGACRIRESRREREVIGISFIRE